MKIGAVIVTYNRLGLLKDCLGKYLSQTRLPDYFVIVDNASTDGTKEYLEEWKSQNKESADIRVIHKSSNTGGSGGFYTGIKEAVKLSVDWVWVSDDDAMPERDVFEKLERYIRNSREDLSAVCCAVVNHGEYDLDHRTRRVKKFIRYKFAGVQKNEYEKESFELDSFSYVGTMICTEKLRQAGNVNRDYFLWYDDTEHSWRLSDIGKIVCLPDVRIHHDVERVRYTDITWKTYYGHRNSLMMIKKHASKRYYIGKKLILLVKGLRDKNKDHLRIIKAAIKDADRNKLGLHEVYKPGWKSDFN